MVLGFIRLTVLICALACCASASAESPYIKLLKSGRLPAERLPTIIGLVAKQGEAEDLSYLLERATAADVKAEEQSILRDGLAEAAATRNLKPSGDLSALKRLLSAESAKSRLAALKLAGLWKLESLAGDIEKLATDSKSSAAVRKAAIE